MSDPDYYYHVALSRQILETGFPETVPQVKGIGWDVLFTDKEFLFHQLSTLFYYLFGEKGLRLLPLVVSAGTLVIMGWHSLQKLSWRYFWLPFLVLAADPYFLRRMFMVRPQVLAVFFFTFMLLGLLQRRKYVVLASTALYTLSYHALQIPVMVLLAGLFTLSPNDDERKKSLWALAIGLAVGILINPYFPGNLMIVPQIFSIVLDAGGAVNLPYGGEIYSWKANYFLNYSAMTFLILAAAIYCLGLQISKKDSSTLFKDQKFLVITTFLFLVVSFMTPRGREYLIPCIFFLAILIVEQRHSLLVTFRALKIPLTAILIITALSQTVMVRKDYPTMIAKENRSKEILSIFDKIPADEKAHVFNCNWSHTPYLFYARPNLSFLDIMDPSFLYREAFDLHKAREDYLRKKFSDPYFLTKHVFKAKYIFCDSSKNNKLLDKDPRFVRLYPDKPVAMDNKEMALFMLPEKDHYRQFVSEYLYQTAQKGKSSSENWIKIQPTLKVSPDAQVARQGIDFFDFKLQLEQGQLIEKMAETKGKDGQLEQEMSMNCVYIKPSPSEIQKYLGSHYLGLGGGPNFRAWLNNKPLFESRGEPEIAAIIQTLIPLPKPLAATDEIKVMVCPGISTDYYGIAMSFFTDKNINDICKEKNSPDTLSQRAALDWPYKGDAIKTCLANIAAHK